MKVGGLRQGYRIKTPPADISALKQKLIERFEMRERNDVDRVRQVVQMAEESGCIVRHLLQHFGENFGRDCGHCSICSGSSRRVIRLPGETNQVKLDEHEGTALQKMNPGALGSARQIARFLCGLNSPLLTQAKLNKHAKFGSLAEVPFQLVMKTAKTVERPKPARPERAVQ